MPPSKDRSELEFRVSENFAQKMHALFKSAPGAYEGRDVLLVERQKREEQRIVTRHGVLRFRREGIFVYEVTQNDIALVTSTEFRYTYSPFYDATRTHACRKWQLGFDDRDYYYFPYDPAVNAKGESRTWKLHPDGHMERAITQAETSFRAWLKQFIPSQTPFFAGPCCPDKLPRYGGELVMSGGSTYPCSKVELPVLLSLPTRSKGESAADQLVEHVKKACTGEYPATRCCLRFKDSVALPWPPPCADYYQRRD